jgi:transposase
MSKKGEIILSVDISSDQLEVMISNNQSVLLRRTFSNTKSGCNRLLRVALMHQVSRCAMEATGGYEQKLVESFCSSGIIVNVLNPARVRKYAYGIGMMAKTDRIDAYVIAKYAREVKPDANFKSSRSQLKLKALISRRNSIKNMIVAEKNRARISDREITLSIKRTIRFFEKEVAVLEKSIDELLHQDQDLEQKVNVVTSQKGISKITACTLIGLMPELGYLNKGQVASLAGLAPFSRDSGKSKGKRFIQGGRFMVRKSLYMPAWVAVQHDPKVNQQYANLIQRGKLPKVAIVAVMRKMIITANNNMKLFYQKNEKIA